MNNILRYFAFSFACIASMATTFSASAQKEIDNPIIAGTNSEYITISKITTSPDSTVFQMELTCYEGLEYTLHEKGSIHAYKMLVGDKTYSLLRVNGIEPGVVQCNMMSVQYFHLVFEALPENAEVITLREGDGSESDLFFDNVLLASLEDATEKAKAGESKYQKFLAKHYEQQYDYESAQEYLNMYIDQVVKEEGTQSKEYLDALSSQIQLNLNIGNYIEAEEISLQTIEAVGVDNPEVANILYTLGDVYQVLGKHEDAVENYIQYLRTMEKGDQLKSATYSMVNNLVMYSWASMTDTLDRQPLAVGVAVNPSKIEEGTAQMRIYAVGATEYMVSDSEEFKGSKWNTYEPALMTEKKLKADTKTLYVRFKDNKNRLSDPFAVKIHSEE
ncbi:tetratricopeptide repeat protein [Bernardetia sp.]|uniref:tetratricopeptide repeat protein n=1 Tax=Bernardetia sp. TaxID=1937974 RepID=UPI0025BABE00|nr:tetratricopeptide repeat protein [Bernardetia sp.]